MLEIIIVAALAACGARPIPAAAEPPDEFEPTEPAVEPVDQHWCCQSVDQKNLTGDGCNTIASTQIDKCDKVLYCEGNWSKDDGHVVCE